LKEIVEDFFQTCKYLIYPIIFVINYKETLLLSVCICERNFPTRTDVYCILSPDSIQNKYRSVHPSQCLLRFQYFARVVVGSKNILQHFPLKGRTYAKLTKFAYALFIELCKSFGTIFEKTFLFAVKYASREKLPAKGHSLGHSFFSFPP